MGLCQDLKWYWQEIKEVAAKLAYRKAHGVDPPDPSRSQHESILYDSCNTSRRPTSSTSPDRAYVVRGFRLLRVTSNGNLSVLGTQVPRMAQDIQVYYDRTGDRSHANSTTNGSTRRLPTNTANSQENDPSAPPPYNEEDEHRRAQYLHYSNMRRRYTRPAVPERASSRSLNSPTAARLPFCIRTTPRASPTDISSPASAVGRLPDRPSHSWI